MKQDFLSSKTRNAGWSANKLAGHLNSVAYCSNWQIQTTATFQALMAFRKKDQRNPVNPVKYSPVFLRNHSLNLFSREAQ